MKLVRTFNDSVSFRNILTQAVNGDSLVICNSRDVNSYAPTPDGVFINVGNSVTLNGNEKQELFRGSNLCQIVCGYHSPHFLMRFGTKFRWSNRPNLLDLADDLSRLKWQVNPTGDKIFWQESDKIFRHDKAEPVFSGEFNDWHVGPNGIIIERKGVLFSQDGNSLGICLTNGEDWEPCPGGIVVESSYGLRLYPPASSPEFLCDQRDIISWKVHSNGILIRSTDHVILLCVYKWVIS